MRNLRLEGKYVYLEEVQPKYFPYVIEWRNNPENNKFLNQPFKLTMELQTKWYEEKYLKDQTQGLLVMVSKLSGKPFGTLGWTDYDSKTRICISGRVLVDGVDNRIRKDFLEATLLYNNYLYYGLKVEKVYAHIVNDNKASISWSCNWGFKLNKGRITFPKELEVNGMIQEEYIRELKDYILIKEKIEKILKI